jgi:hypothetical protein
MQPRSQQFAISDFRVLNLPGGMDETKPAEPVERFPGVLIAFRAGRICQGNGLCKAAEKTKCGLVDDCRSARSQRVE